jgi:hypothetical protein
MEFSEVGKEVLRGKQVLRTSSAAQSCLRALLERPEFLGSEQKSQLAALVGPEWRRLGVDIEKHKKWSERAGELLRAIDGTPGQALSDVHWTSLLGQAQEAVKEAQVAVRRIQFSLSIEDLGGGSIRRPEDPGGGSIRRPEDPGGGSIRRPF